MIPLILTILGRFGLIRAAGGRRVVDAFLNDGHVSPSNLVGRSFIPGRGLVCLYVNTTYTHENDGDNRCTCQAPGIYA